MDSCINPSGQFGADDTAGSKMKIMKECGIRVVESPAEIGEAMADELRKAGKS